MKESVMDVLLYLFQHYIDNEEGQPDKATLESELERVGFPTGEINKAISWLENMTILAEATDDTNPITAMRFYTTQEQAILNTACRGYLLFLEQVGILEPETREIVIERVMALDNQDIELEHLKWVVLMVLFYQPNREVAYAWMEDLVFDDIEAGIH